MLMLNGDNIKKISLAYIQPADNHLSVCIWTVPPEEKNRICRPR